MSILRYETDLVTTQYYGPLVTTYHRLIGAPLNQLAVIELNPLPFNPVLPPRLSSLRFQSPKYCTRSNPLEGGTGHLALCHGPQRSVA